MDELLEAECITNDIEKGIIEKKFYSNANDVCIGVYCPGLWKKKERKKTNAENLLIKDISQKIEESSRGVDTLCLSEIKMGKVG